MSFEAPYFLVFLLFVPLLLWAFHHAQAQRRRQAIRMPAVATLKAVVQRQPRYRRWLPVGFLALCVALLSVALTRPEVSVSSPDSRSSVMLVIDHSFSMSAEDVQPTRIAAAREAATRFLAGVPKQTRVGVISYSDDITTVSQGPTTDRSKVRAIIDGLTPTGGTATGDALTSALNAIRSEGKAEGGRRPPGTIVLLSDGKADPDQQPLVAARQAKLDRVPIYTVSLGTPSGFIRDPVTGQTQDAPPDPTTMREIAQVSGGEAYDVADATRLNRIYQDLGSRVATEPEQREITYAFAIAALLALAIAVGFGVRWRQRVIA